MTTKPKFIQLLKLDVFTPNTWLHGSTHRHRVCVNTCHGMAGPYNVHHRHHRRPHRKLAEIRTAGNLYMLLYFATVSYPHLVLLWDNAGLMIL